MSEYVLIAAAALLMVIGVVSEVGHYAQKKLNSIFLVQQAPTTIQVSPKR